MRLNLLKDCKVVKCGNGNVANTGTVTSSTVDASGFDSCLVLADLAAVVDNAVATLALQDGALSNGSDATNISGANCAFTASSSNNVQMLLDVQLPQSRYLTVTLGRATQNITVNSLTLLLYNAKSKAVTQPTTIAASAEINATS